MPRALNRGEKGGHGVAPCLSAVGKRPGNVGEPEENLLPERRRTKRGKARDGARKHCAY